MTTQQINPSHNRPTVAIGGHTYQLWVGQPGQRIVYRWVTPTLAELVAEIRKDRNSSKWRPWVSGHPIGEPAKERDAFSRAVAFLSS